MQIKVTDIHKSHINDIIYGYCTCGREVRRGKDKTCPACKAELIWACAFDKDRLCGIGCKHYQTCVRKW